VEVAGVALQVVSMEQLRMEVVLEPERTGDSVAEVCRRRGISRETFYVYRRRYLNEGVDGLVSRSRRPRGSPARIDPQLEATICRLRREHPRWGARRIRAELARAGVDPPAKSTIHRALQRNGLIAPQPPRRPKPTRRLCFVAAAAQHGLPRQLLSDNGTCFTGRLQGFEADFERRLGEVGVRVDLRRARAPRDARQARPGRRAGQTLRRERREQVAGVVVEHIDHPDPLAAGQLELGCVDLPEIVRERALERFHRTLKEWLHDQGPASDLEQLQRLLDRFRTHYNEERPHQGIGDHTPAERYWPTPLPVEPLGELTLAEQQQPRYPARALVRNVSKNGMIAFQNMRIGVGRRYAGANLRLVPLGELVHIYYGNELIRIAALDRRRYYQPQATKRTRRR
jgi:transposase